MTNTLTHTDKPRNAQQAVRLARCWEKAQQLTAQGYTFEVATLKDAPLPDTYHVNTPEHRFHTVNVEAACCTCEDWQKHRDICKHILWVKEELRLQAEHAQQALTLTVEEEVSALDAYCKEWDGERERLLTGVPECLLPAPYAVPEPDETVLTVRALLEALQVRMVKDLEAARELASVYKIGVKDSRDRRVCQLETALLVIGEYWGKELCNRLDLQPADKVTL